MEHICNYIQPSGNMQNWITLGITIAGALIGGLFSYLIALSSIKEQFKNQKKWDNEKRRIEIEDKKKYIEKSIHMFLIPELLANKDNLNKNNYSNFNKGLEAYVASRNEFTCGRLVFTQFEEIKSTLFELCENDIYSKIINVYSTLKLIKDYQPYRELSIIKFDKDDYVTYDKLMNLTSQMENLIFLLKEINN